MYLSDYLVFILALLACMVFSMIAGGKVKSAYSAYSRVPCRSGLSGRETAERLLRMNGVYDIALGRVSGELTRPLCPEPEHRESLDGHRGQPLRRRRSGCRA